MEKLMALFENGSILCIKELDIEFQLLVSFARSDRDIDHFIKFTPVKINSIDWTNMELNASIMFEHLSPEEIHNIRVDAISKWQ